MNEKIDIRAGCLVIDNDHILGIKAKYDSSFYLLPGGAVEQGETIEQAAIRETEEETGIKVNVKGIIYVNEYRSKNPENPCLNIIFLAEKKGGSLREGATDGGKVQKALWIPIKDIKTYDLRPAFIKDHLTKHRKLELRTTTYIVD
jgi:8-oxo-dGTP diphosphatase